nr:hypothetical protein [Nocardia crassostreae]
MLRALNSDGLRAAIEGPARVAGLRLDDGLVSDLLTGTGGGAGLPLLAYTLEQLADGVARGGVLSRKRYHEIGGLRGALVRQAEAALAEASAGSGLSREQVISTLLQLVTVDEGKTPVRGQVHRDEFSAAATVVIDAFIEHRLLTTDVEDERVVVSVAHEAFLEHWPPLHAEIERTAVALRARREVESAAAGWAEDPRPKARRWEGLRLEAAMHDLGARMRAIPFARWTWPPRFRRLVAERVEISTRAQQFLESSYRHDRRRRTTAVVVLSTLLTAALIAAAIAVVQQCTAVAQQHRAVARQLLAQADRLREADPRTALRLGVAANSIDPSEEARRWLIDALSATRYLATLDGSGSVRRVVHSPDGHLLAVQHEGGTIALWDLSGAAGPRRIGDPIDGVSDSAPPAFTADGRTLLAGAGRPPNATGLGGLLAWDLGEPEKRTIATYALPGVPEDAWLAFAPGAAIGITKGDGQATLLWSFGDIAEPRGDSDIAARGGAAANRRLLARWQDGDHRRCGKCCALGYHGSGCTPASRRAHLGKGRISAADGLFRRRPDAGHRCVRRGHPALGHQRSGAPAQPGRTDHRRFLGVRPDCFHQERQHPRDRTGIRQPGLSLRFDRPERSRRHRRTAFRTGGRGRRARIRAERATRRRQR